MIKAFKDEYEWLSNFWMCDIEYEGEIYPSVEHAYQCQKTTSMELRKKIKDCPFPGQAKKFGKRIQIRPQWGFMKIDIMEELVRKKFEIPDLREKLLTTGEGELQEGNYWGDDFWGVDLKTGKGSNVLGQILMKIRSELRRNQNP